MTDDLIESKELFVYATESEHGFFISGTVVVKIKGKIKEIGFQDCIMRDVGL